MNTLILLQLIREHRKLRQRDRWTRKRLEAYQASGLCHLREYAYAHSSFYQRFHRGFIDRLLQELPVLTKAMMMEHFDELVTDRAIRLDEVKAHQANMRGDERYLGRYWVNATSGSSRRLHHPMAHVSAGRRNAAQLVGTNAASGCERADGEHCPAP